MDLRITIIRLAIWLIAALGAAGCRAPVGQELLLRENRELEDENHQLQGLIEDQCNLIDGLTEENRRLKEQRGTLDGRMRGEPSPLKRREGRGGSRVLVEPDADVLPEPDLGQVRPVDRGETSARMQASAAVTNLKVERRLRPAAGGRPAGLSVRLWLKDPLGETVTAAGGLSLVASLPAGEGAMRRVARWDFSPEEVASRVRRTPAGDAVFLDLDWPVEAPENAQLRLYVQFSTHDGRLVKSDVPLDRRPLAAGDRDWTAVDPPGRLTSHGEETGPSTPREAKKSPRKPQWSPHR